MARSVVISAAYGMGNLGDEAICEAVVRPILSRDQESKITILVFNRELFLQAHPEWKNNPRITIAHVLRGSWRVIFADTFIWGGGGIIRNRPVWLKKYIWPLQVAQFLKKKAIIQSIGVDKISDPEVIRILNTIRKVREFSVRDEQSKRNFLEVSNHVSEPEIKVTRDPVFNSMPTSRVVHDGKRLGFNLTYWKADFSNTNEVENFVDKFAEVLRRTGATLVYLPTAKSRDAHVFDLISKKIKVETPKVTTPREYLNELSKLDYFIGMRMHSIIMATNVADLPIMGVIYDEKVESLSKMNLPVKFVTIAEFINNSATQEILK